MATVEKEESTKRGFLDSTSSDGSNQTPRTMASGPSGGLPPVAPTLSTSSVASPRSVALQTRSFNEKREASSVISSRSTKSNSIVRRVSGVFGRKRKTPMQMHATIVTSSAQMEETVLESLSENSTLQLQSSFTQALSDMEQVKNHLNTLAGQLENAEMKLNKVLISTQMSKNLWMLRMALLCAVPVIVVLFPKYEAEVHVWLLALLVSAAIYLANGDKVPVADLESANQDILSASTLLKKASDDASRISSAADVSQEQVSPAEEAPSEIIPVTDISAIPAETSRNHTMIDNNKMEEAGFRLNFYANIPNLDFERDALSKLPQEKQKIFLQFEQCFNSTFDPKCVKYKENIPDRFTLLRFLQADKYDIDKAVARMIKTPQWRETSGVDDFVDKPNRQMLLRGAALRPRILCGVDKHNRPMYFEKLGEFFGSDEAYRGLTMPEWIRVYTYELGEVSATFRQIMQRPGVPYHHKMSYVGDLSHIRYLTAIKMIPFLKMLVKEVEYYYPEFAGPVTLINVPTSVARLFAIVKKFLDPATAEKITVTSENGLKEMEEIYGLDVIPQEYGGRNPIKIPACPKKLTAEFEATYPYQKDE